MVVIFADEARLGNWRQIKGQPPYTIEIKVEFSQLNRERWTLVELQDIQKTVIAKLRRHYGFGATPTHTQVETEVVV